MTQEEPWNEIQHEELNEAQKLILGIHDHQAFIGNNLEKLVEVIAAKNQENERLSAEIERLKELSESQSNYIDFLSAAIAQPVSFLHVHNWHYSEEDVKEGKELREKIAEIKMKFPKR